MRTTAIRLLSPGYRADTRASTFNGPSVSLIVADRAARPGQASRLPNGPVEEHTILAPLSPPRAL